MTLEPAGPINKQQKLAWEKELLGIYISEHPLDEVKHLLPADIILTNELNCQLASQTVKIAGVIQKIQKVITRNGQPMMFVTLEDTAGSVEVLIFPKVLEATREIWLEGRMVIVRGKVSEKDSAPKILCDDVKIISHETLAKQTLVLTIPQEKSKTNVEDLKKIIAKYPGPQPIYLELFQNGQAKKIKLTQTVNYSPELIAELNKLLGNKNVIFR